MIFGAMSQQSPAIPSARYRHTNLVARDWRCLAEFYESVFGCEPLEPDRDFGGAWLDRLTGLEHAWIRGRHLRLPGGGSEGPTIEIFQYDEPLDSPVPAANQPGFAHIAFEVDDVEAALNAVKRAGGGVLGEIVTITVADAGEITLVYATDPEGNLVELQTWHANSE